MGYMRHHSILVSSYGIEHADPAHEAAVRIFGEGQVSELTETNINGYLVFCVHPDGSKEGWEDSDQGNAKRDEFVAHLDIVNAKCRWVQWCEVQWADDDGEALVTRHSNDPERPVEE